jgi:hypothetical protein
MLKCRQVAVSGIPEHLNSSWENRDGLLSRLRCRNPNSMAQTVLRCCRLRWYGHNHRTGTRQRRVRTYSNQRSTSGPIRFAGGELRQAHVDFWIARNARAVTNPADPFDSPEEIVIRKGVDRVNGVAHWQMITNFYRSFANSVVAPFARKVIEHGSICK